MPPGNRSDVRLRLLTISMGCGIASLFVIVFANYVLGIDPFTAKKLAVIVAPIWIGLTLRELRRNAGLR
jgi:hypothetical protein